MESTNLSAYWYCTNRYWGQKWSNIYFILILGNLYLSNSTVWYIKIYNWLYVFEKCTNILGNAYLYFLNIGTILKKKSHHMVQYAIRRFGFHPKIARFFFNLLNSVMATFYYGFSLYLNMHIWQTFYIISSDYRNYRHKY